MTPKKCTCRTWKREEDWSTPREDGEWTVGYCDTPIKYCPWCGKKLFRPRKKKNENQR